MTKNSFHLLNGKKSKNMEIETASTSTDYASPEILINRVIPLDERDAIRSYDRDQDEVDELDTNRLYLFLIRDFVLSSVYWLSLMIGLFCDRSLFLFGGPSTTMALSVFCHFYFLSPPFYALYRGSDCVYRRNFDKSAVQFVGAWNGRHSESEAPRIRGNERSLQMKLFYIELFGGMRSILVFISFSFI